MLSHVNKNYNRRREQKSDDGDDAVDSGKQNVKC